ncbi:MAG TPA: Wzz/FepE/Etk N-terminal domain-containing protein [Edaphobacter sp.]|nr:Wzz/FepE/Etk N-terminal domain-containing protein [Edaphobacter sp.]
MLQETLIEKRETRTEAGSDPTELQQPSDQDEVDLIKLATLLLREKKTILRSAFLLLVITAIVVYLIIKPTYTGEAVFLPPQSSPGSSISQLAGQMGSLGAIGGLAGLKSPGDVYIGILGSRTIADGMIERFDLQKAYKTKKLSDTEKKLKNNSKFTLGKDTLIAISVEDHDPKRAADLANGYLDSLRLQNGRLALTEASQRRLFFEQQLEREKNALADAEVDLKKTQEHTGLIVPSGQAQVQIEEMAQIRAQISGHQVELAALRQGATDLNPQVVRLQTQIAGLQQELQKLQSDPSQHQPGSVQLSTAKVPELALEYVRKQREVKYHEVLFELIAKQYEAARLDESREAPLLQVVDRATIPDKKSGPPRTLLIFGSCLLGALAGAVWVIWKSFVATLQQDPTNAKKLQALREAALLRR